MATKSGRSSYRNTFGSQTAYSTAGSKAYSKNYVIEEPVVSKRVSYSYSASSSGGAGGGLGGSTRMSMGSMGTMGSVGMMEADMLNLKMNEKELLNGLNNRFAAYIEKVRYLEEQNEKLEKMLKEKSYKKETELGADKLEKLRRLREQVNDATLAKVRSEIARDNLRGQASEYRWKIDHEARLRAELDDELARLRKDVDDATMVRVDLERKIETLKEELEYGKKLRQEEVDDLKEQIKNQGVNIVVEDGIAPDIAELLKQIRAQYEQMVMKNKDEAEQWYKSKFDDLQGKAKANLQDLENVQSEINNYRKQVVQMEMELESLRGSNEYLERNLADVEKRYELEGGRYQTRIATLTGDLELAMTEMKRHLADYKHLMNIKLSLEKEIMTYRMLLEGDEKAKSRRSSSSSSDGEYQTKTTKKVIVKTIETRDGKIVSSSVSEKELVEENDSSSSSDEE